MKYKRFIVIFFSSIVVFAFIPRIYRSYEKITRLNAELTSLKEKKDILNENIKEYERDIKNLDNEFYREKLVREKLKMVKPGEEIYKVLIK
nr:septum formation initiator family protein [Fusobacterium sp. FSA-380-WT-3A]